MSFADHFSGVSAAYAAFRPRYPSALFDFLAQAAPARNAAWDCGTGSGQAAGGGGTTRVARWPIAMRAGRVS